MAQDDYNDITLDTGRHHSTVFPPENGAHFMQDGFYFTAHGALAPDMLDDDALARLKRLKAQKSAQVAARKARDAQLIKDGFDPKEFDESDSLETIGKKVAPGGIDLIAWATGTDKHPWFTVVAEAQKQYNFVASSASNLIEFMIDNKMVTEDQIAKGARK